MILFSYCTNFHYFCIIIADDDGISKKLLIFINPKLIKAMKKYYMILAAIAALTMTAQAQFLGWIEVGDYYNGTEIYNGSYFDTAPTSFYLAHTGSQMIYTPDLLTSMRGKDGVKVKYLNFKFRSDSYEEIIRNAKVYLQEIEATEFAINKYGIKQFFDLGELVAEGRYDLDLLENYGEDMVLAMEIEEPFDFTLGNSLLVTIVLDAEDDDNCTAGSDYAPFYTSGIRGKAMTYTDNHISFVDYAMGNDFPDATAMLGCGTNVDLPVTEIGYCYDRMLGDANGDGDVNIADVSDMIDYLLGITPEYFYIVNADLNEDESVNIADVTSAIDMLLIGF